MPTPAPGAPLTGGVDTHLHLTMSSAAKPVMVGEPGDGVPVAMSPAARWVNAVTEAQLHASGVTLVFGGLWPPFRARPGRSALAEGLRIQIFWRLAGISDAAADHYLRKQRSELDWIRRAMRAHDLGPGWDGRPL